MAASSSTTSIPKPKRYDVFLSFRGEDTRSDFISHLREALSSNQISTFIDNNLRRGDDISPSLRTAIEESMISVIIFSQNYASSKWCLKELAKILECKHLNGQVVIPVFYGGDPSHVRNQSGEFAVAFDKLKERLQEGEMDLNMVRSHLEEAANISGWNSQIISPESKLKSIVGDILNKFNRMTLNLPSSLVGIGSHVERVETLLCLESPKLRTVGLWGMGGIGKTTVAQTVYYRICSKFDGFYFVEKVSEKLKNQSVEDLREKIALKLFEEESLNIGSRTLHPNFIMKQLQRKKVLIVLDDVVDAIEVKKLLTGANGHLFHGSSRIIVTSRDKQVLKNIVGDENLIYEVEGLSEEESLQLFSLCAFEQNHLTSDYLELSNKVLSYARGNPLALVVLGHALFDKSVEQWHSALDELGEEPFPGIQEVLRIGYDALCDEEKTIFLDVACVLVGKKLDFVVAYYNGYVKRIEYKIRNLVDKSLLTISEGRKLEMHDLLKEMGRFFESTKKLEERKRIWDFKDVTRLSKKKGSSMVEAISVNLSQVERISEFDCNVLSKLDCLKFLDFRHHASAESEMRFCWERFGDFPEELRHFRWNAYPQTSVQMSLILSLSQGERKTLEFDYRMFGRLDGLKFHADMGSKVKFRWDGFRGFPREIRYFRWDAYPQIYLPSNSPVENLGELHMLHTKIREINLSYCIRFVELRPSVQHLPMLIVLSPLNFV